MKKEKSIERFMTREAIARHFGITRMTLYRWSKIVPLTSYPGKHVWMDEDEVATWQKRVRVKEAEEFSKRIS